MKRVLWDTYEAALLVDAYWKIEKAPEEKSHILMELSETLRRMAIRRGMVIGSTYRNYNGMKLQYGLLQYCITNGEKGLSGHISKTIMEVSDTYNNDRHTYFSILSRAKEWSSL